MNELPTKTLIGVLTAQKSNGSFAGDRKFFAELQTKLISLNGMSFVFTLEDTGHNSIFGYCFLPQENRWIKKAFPYPKVIYNRIPFRKLEKKEEFQSFYTSIKEKNIPFFNPGFIDKYELFQVLKQQPMLTKYIPETIFVRQKTDFFTFLLTHTSIYLKPANSSKGNGVFRIQLLLDHHLKLDGRNRSITYTSFDEFWEIWSDRLLKKRYVAQEAIDPEQYEGHRFDFRLLAHAADDDYQLTGVGVRMSQDQEITTHIPSGGKLIPYELLQSDAHDQFFQTIVSPIGKALSQHYGFFGEYSIDVGLSKAGQYYIYEVNSKPMSFDEPNIEDKKINSLCRLFLQLVNN